MTKLPLLPNVERTAPSSNVCVPLTPVHSEIPDPTVCSEVEILESKIQSARVAEHLALRERHTLRTSLRTDSIRIAYLQASCDVVRAERNCLLSGLSQVKRGHDQATSQLAKFRSDHASLKYRLDQKEKALHALRRECDVLKGTSKTEYEDAKTRKEQALVAVKTEMELISKSCSEWKGKYENAMVLFGDTVESRNLERKKESEKMAQLEKLIINHNVTYHRDTPKDKTAGPNEKPHEPLPMSFESMLEQLDKLYSDCHNWRCKYESLAAAKSKDDEDHQTNVVSLEKSILDLQNECSNWRKEFANPRKGMKKPVSQSPEKDHRKDEVIASLQAELEDWRRRYDEAVKTSTNTGNKNRKCGSCQMDLLNTAHGNLISPAPLHKRTPRDVRSESKSRLTGTLPFSLCEDENDIDASGPPNVMNRETPPPAIKRFEASSNGPRERSRKRTRLGAGEFRENEILEDGKDTQESVTAKEKTRCSRELLSLGSSMVDRNPNSDRNGNVMVPAEDGLGNGHKSLRAGSSSVKPDVVRTRAHKRSEQVQGEGVRTDNQEPRTVTRRMSNLSNDRLLPAKASSEMAAGRSRGKKEHEGANRMTLRNKEGVTAKLPERVSLRRQDTGTPGGKTKAKTEFNGNKSAEGDSVNRAGLPKLGRGFRRKSSASAGDGKAVNASTAERSPLDGSNNQRNATRASSVRRSMGENRNGDVEPRSRLEKEHGTRSSRAKRSRSLASFGKRRKG